jgi:hypothetical protein
MGKRSGRADEQYVECRRVCYALESRGRGWSGRVRRGGARTGVGGEWSSSSSRGSRRSCEGTRKGWAAGTTAYTVLVAGGREAHV